MFNIPMNTKGALSADSLLSLNNGGMASQQGQSMAQQPQMQQSQPMMQQPQMQ